jgi:hypothetical protein
VTFCDVLNWTLVLLPGVMFWNDHDQLVGVLPDVSLNFTVKLSVPDVTFAVKLVTGRTAAVLTLMKYVPGVIF